MGAGGGWGEPAAFGVRDGDPMALHPIDFKLWHRGSGTGPVSKRSQMLQELHFPHRSLGTFGCSRGGKLRQQGGPWWWSALCAPKGNESTRLGSDNSGIPLPTLGTARLPRVPVPSGA